MPPIRVVCVDDNSDILTALRYILRMGRDVECAACLTSTANLLTELVRLRADVLLLDFRIPGEDTLEVMREVRRMAPACACLVLSSHDDERTVQSAINAGAICCLSKDLAAEKLLDTIHAIAADSSGGASIKAAVASTN